MKWEKVVSRPYNLLKICYSQFGYSQIPGFAFKNVLIVGKNGAVVRYLNETELQQHYQFIRDNKNLQDIFKKGVQLDAKLAEFFNKDPITSFPEFNKLYVEYWGYLLLGYYVGQIFSEEEIAPFKEEAELLRGFNSAREKIEAVFLPQLLKQYEEKTGISASLLSYALPFELIENKLDPLELEKRKKLYVWMIKDGKKTFVSGDEAKVIIAEELGESEDKFSDLKELKGAVACKGKAKGKVRLITNTAEIKDFQEGEVLVTSMTSPDYVPAMEKAVAFVTDEGGLLSHAAIVSREMKKPCVIGTKIATKVFKDGDIVEVDADKGVVKKI
jgi:phosphohistidine swiveling domain-containing protein